MSLVAWYKLDGDVTDSSPNGLDGTAYNITYGNGIIGQCATFVDATNGHADSSLVAINGVSTYFTASNRISVVGWIRCTDASNAAASFVNFNTSSGNNGVLSRLNGSGYFTIYDSVSFVLTYSVDLRDSKWHHVGFTYDKNLASNNFEFFVDGVSQGTATSTNVTFNATDVCSIGQEFDSGVTIPTNTSDHFEGDMNDIRIYNHILSRKEIKELSRCKVLHFKFDIDRDQANDIVPDSSDYGFHGVIASGREPTWTSTTNRGLGAYIFTGTTSPNADNFSFAQTFSKRTVNADLTIMAWVKVVTEPTHSSISVGPIVGLSPYGFGIYFGVTIGIICILDSTDVYLFQDKAETNATGLYNGNWHHIAWAYKENVDDDTLEIYVDATLLTDGLTSNLTGTYSFTYDPMYVGNPNSVTTDGEIHYSDIRWYNRYLSQADIQEIMQAGASIDNKGNLWC